MRKSETKTYLTKTENYYGLNTFWTAELLPIF